MHVFKNAVNQCEAGQHCGILARGVKPDIVRRGMVAVAPGSVVQTNLIEASIYVLKKEEGGRYKPIMPGYVQPFMTSMATIDSHFILPKDKEMLLGGDTLNLNLLLKSPMAFQVGDRFTSNYNLKIISFFHNFWFNFI